MLSLGFGRMSVRRFRYPLGDCASIAVFAPGFDQAPGVSIYPAEELINPGKLGVQTIAAPITLLRRMPASGWIPEFPIVAFTGIAYGSMTEADRELLWNVFEVPIFEQMIGPEDRVVAEECEAHEGLHILHNRAQVEDGRVVFTVPGGKIDSHFRARLDKHLCHCGIAGPRLMDIHPGPADTAATMVDSSHAADVAKLADALDLGSSSRKGV